MTRFALAPQPDFQLLPLGSGGEQLLLADGVMQDWHELRDTAARCTFTPTPVHGYPGLRASLPGDYARTLLRRLDPLIRQVFFAGREVELARFDCNFSLVTLQAGELHPLQKLPHLDFASENRIAVLHYLCGPQFGGTAFYRQLATGLERVGPSERVQWQAARAQELALLGPLHSYPDTATPGYEQTTAVPIRPDRLIAYRSHNLHSGVIDRPELLSDNPRKGRLTANFFLDYSATSP